MLARFERGFVWINKAAVGGLLFVMTVLVFTNVLLRYLFGESIGWVEELSRYLMIWLAWLAIGLASRAGAHIALDLLETALPDFAAMLLRAAIFLIVAAFFAALIVVGAQYAAFAWNSTTPMLRLPFGLVYLAVPVGSALTLVHLLLTAHRDITRRRTVEDQAQAAEMGML